MINAFTRYHFYPNRHWDSSHSWIARVEKE